MTDLLTENARLRAALAPFAMIADLIDEETEGVSTTDEFGLFFLNGENDDPVWFAERFSVQKFQEARAALATSAPDAVQEAARFLAEAIDKDMQTFNRSLTAVDLSPDMPVRHFFSRALVAYANTLRAIAGDRT